MTQFVPSMFTEWLKGTLSVSTDGRYRHRRLDENVELRPQVLALLTSLVQQAHEDARRHIRQVAGISLDPLEPPLVRDPSEGYPALLHIDTLKGYLGEILAGLICEHFSPHGEHGWRVPAYLFRFHRVAFQQLERIRQTGEEATALPGRTGNDCLAFIRGDQGEIIGVLFCEAKCTSDHDSEMVRKAHEQVSDATLLPVSLLEVIEVLGDRTDPEACEWVAALRQLHLDRRAPGCERYDLVSYACGRAPVKRRSWLAAERPHSSYTGGRKLEAIEIHLADVERLIKVVYGR